MNQPQGTKSCPSDAFLASVHPSGNAADILLVDAPAQRSNNAGAHTVVLTMADAQCRDARLRQAMIAAAVAALAKDGIISVHVPGRWRRAMMSALAAAGLVIGQTTVHRRRGNARSEFPLTARGLRFALSTGVVSERWRYALFLLERTPVGWAALLRALPDVGFVACWPGTMPFDWLVQKLDSPAGAQVALTTSWRGDAAPFVLSVLGEIETLAAKRGGPDSRSALKHEAQALAELAEGAADAGLQIPSLVDASFTSGLSIVVESAVPGRPMAGLIREGHCDIGKLAARLAEWLAGWNARTVRHVELTPALADRWILSPARELASELEHGAAYQDWLAAQTARLLSRPVPLVAAHNDLTMANVLGDRSGPRSVVDWEVASADGMPLTDFVYVVWDAAAIANGGDRVSAFGECFRDDGRWRAAIGECEARLRTVVGGPDEWLDLCFHAAWLCHATNEQARSPSRRDPAFLEIVRELAGAVLGDRRKLLSS